MNRRIIDVLIVTVVFITCRNEVKDGNSLTYERLSDSSFSTFYNKDSFRLKDIRQYAVFFFLSPECPLCQSYNKTIHKLYESFHSEEVEFVGVAPGDLYSDREWINYIDSFQVVMKIISDKNFLLTDFFNATSTPEVFVMSNKGNIVYQGRIDNWAYEIGKKRTVVTENDLRDVLIKLKNQEQVEYRKTEAVGCIIQRN